MRSCHSSALRGGHHPIRMPSDGDLGQWDTILRRNISHPPSRTCDRTSADTAIHAPGETRGKDEQNPEDHGGPVLRGRSKEVGRPSSGADVRPQHLTPRVDEVHASAAELWPLTRGTQCSPPSDTWKCRRGRSARRHRRRSTRRHRRRGGQRSCRRRSPLRDAPLVERHLRTRPGELSTRICETKQVYNLRRREWRCHLGDRVLKRDHPLSSGAKGFATKLAPKYSGPYTVTKVLSPVLYNLRSPSGQKILRAHIKDLKPYRMTEPPTDCANIYRMPDPRAPPAPADLPSAKQQLRRRQAGQAELTQAARWAAHQLQQRFRRTPQTPQDGKRRTRNPKEVRNPPTPLQTGPTASGENPLLPQTRPAASICWIGGSDRRAFPRLTGESRGPGTPMDLTVRRRQHDPTPPLPLPPPRVPDRSPSPGDSTPPISTPTGPAEKHRLRAARPNTPCSRQTIPRERPPPRRQQR
jgi:hypothetical protein